MIRDYPVRTDFASIRNLRGREGAAWVVASLGIGYFRQVGNPPPPDPEPIAVNPGLRLAYVCDMCGLELAVLKVAKDRAPKHCGETMTLVRRPAAEGEVAEGEDV